MTATAAYTRKTFYQEPIDFRIGAIISDGMWYSLPKWRKLAKCTEEEIDAWIKRETEAGRLEQSPTGAKSYRFPLSSIEEWYSVNERVIGSQLIEFLFPPRIWDGMTETDGFLKAPLREIGIVSFDSNTRVSQEVAKALRGVARIRQVEPGRYKAYGLNAGYIKEIVESVLKKHPREGREKTYSRSESKRREVVDFTPEFSSGLVMFYKQFGRTLVKPMMETIKIFLPDPEDQESQITMWVLEAIEKFDESSSVPFSGYLNSVLRRWPYDLPSIHLGKDLSSFQRTRSKAIQALAARNPEAKSFTSEVIAEEMGMDFNEFAGFDEKHKVWTRAQTATTLTWDENSDEKLVDQNLSGDLSADSSQTDVVLASRLSLAVVEAAKATGDFDDAYFIISQIDSSEVNLSQLGDLSPSFIRSLGASLQAPPAPVESEDD